MAERRDSAPVIVLLAAGESRRFGGIKQLADIDGETMVHRAARTALATGVALIVVTGANAEQVGAALSDLPLHIVHHAGWADGMGSSLAAGIRYVVDRYPQATGALLCLADQPLLESSSLSHMLDRHAEMPAHILVTEHMGIAAPPVLFPSDCFAELRHWSGKQGAQDLVKREMHRVESFASNIVFDVDTVGDLVRVRNRLAAVREN
jgi:molybdenum cofactor cytidylyltransferase